MKRKLLYAFLFCTCILNCKNVYAVELESYDEMYPIFSTYATPEQIEKGKEETYKRVQEQFNHEYTSESSKTDKNEKQKTKHTVVLRMVGDCIVNKPIYEASKKSNDTYDFTKLFDNVLNDISSADIALINQETIFASEPSNVSSSPYFGSPIELGEAEIKAGFDIVNHATNHVLDKGLIGVNDTLNFWKEHEDVRALGIHESDVESDIAYVQKNNIKFAFLNYTYNVSDFDDKLNNNSYILDRLTDDDVEENLIDAKNNSDIVIAILHIGDEYSYKPTEYVIEQVDRFIDNGADIVICSHPHIVQPYEIRETDNKNKGVVYYSLGNFMSNQDTIDRILGGMAEISITKELKDKGGDINDPNNWETKVEEYNLIPLVTHQQEGYYSTYRLDEYSDGLCKMHKLYDKEELSMVNLRKLFKSLTSK